MTESALFQLPARLTQVEAMHILGELEHAIASGLRAVDLRLLSEFDSAALAVLLAARRSAASVGVSAQDPLRFINVPENLAKLAHLYGVDSLVFPND